MDGAQLRLRAVPFLELHLGGRGRPAQSTALHGAFSGSHDQLMDRGGLYAELFTLQAKAYLGAAQPNQV